MEWGQKARHMGSIRMGMHARAGKRMASIGRPKACIARSSGLQSRPIGVHRPRIRQSSGVHERARRVTPALGGESRAIARALV